MLTYNVKYMASWGLNVLTYRAVKNLIKSTNVANWNKPPICYIQCYRAFNFTRMKVNYIDENGNNTIKDIDVDFKNMSESYIQKVFEGCTNLKNIPEMNLSNITKEDIQKVFNKCKKEGIL